MTTQQKSTHAALIFDDVRDFDIVALANRVRNTFEKLDERVTGVRIHTDTCATVHAAHHNIEITLCEEPFVDGSNTPAQCAIELTITDTSAATETQISFAPDTILAHALKALHWSLSADRIKWVMPGAVLSSADFIMATTHAAPPAPRRVSPSRAGVQVGIDALPTVEDTNDRIQTRLTHKDALMTSPDDLDHLREDLKRANDAPRVEETVREETAPLRLSVWMLSFTVALFALPVGAALLFFNLVKGENLRVASQVAALTGTFISLEAYGATAQAMTVLKDMVG